MLFWKPLSEGSTLRGTRRLSNSLFDKGMNPGANGVRGTADQCNRDAANTDISNQCMYESGMSTFCGVTKGWFSELLFGFSFFQRAFLSSFLKSGTTKEISDGLYTLPTTGWKYMSLTKKNGDVNWYKRGIFTKYNLYHVATLSKWSRDDSRMCYSAAVPVEVWRPRPLSPESFKMTIRRKKETHSFCCLLVVSPSLLLRGSQWVVYRNVCIRTFHQHNNADIPSISFLFLLGSVSNHGCQLDLLLLPWTSA